ncbi:hypothetical protein PILCRDRAFT_262778 [Piloderma croceum F 1598]|uniref:Zn(2)-C6 fungal-type domain-containing protein n=1 Tax=Piloderma croceum (strain F 1598) TaxID=765440 RepID=A0A0C3G7T2_PILCF|nr:hypothetical protein PILCRDRAFT_262778 [Piloderma croceum F 1598]
MFTQLASHQEDPVPPKQRRAKFACSRCRKLKIRCSNNADGTTPCEACESKRYICEYTQVVPANTAASPTSIASSPMIRHSSGPSGVVRQGTIGANCLCNISGEHDCVIPQIPVGQLSEVVSALGVENAQRMRNPDDPNR